MTSNSTGLQSNPTSNNNVGGQGNDDLDSQSSGNIEAGVNTS